MSPRTESAFMGRKRVTRGVTARAAGSLGQDERLGAAAIASVQLAAFSTRELRPVGRVAGCACSDGELGVEV